MTGNGFECSDGKIKGKVACCETKTKRCKAIKGLLLMAPVKLQSDPSIHPPHPKCFSKHFRDEKLGYTLNKNVDAILKLWEEYFCLAAILFPQGHLVITVFVDILKVSFLCSIVSPPPSNYLVSSH